MRIPRIVKVPGALCLLGCFLASCTIARAEESEPGAGTSQELATPMRLVDAWVAMWNRYDLNQVGRLFVTDHRLTYFSSEFEGVIRGFDSVVAHHRGFGFAPGGSRRDTRLWVEDLTEDRFGDTAILTGIWYFRGEGEEGPTQKGPVTFVCVREEGRWRFAHMTFGNYPE